MRRMSPAEAAEILRPRSFVLPKRGILIRLFFFAACAVPLLGYSLRLAEFQGMPRSFMEFHGIPFGWILMWGIAAGLAAGAIFLTPMLLSCIPGLVMAEITQTHLVVRSTWLWKTRIPLTDLSRIEIGGDEDGQTYVVWEQNGRERLTWLAGYVDDQGEALHELGSKIIRAVRVRDSADRA